MRVTVRRRPRDARPARVPWAVGSDARSEMSTSRAPATNRTAKPHATQSAADTGPARDNLGITTHQQKFWHYAATSCRTNTGLPGRCSDSRREGARLLAWNASAQTSRTDRPSRPAGNGHRATWRWRNGASGTSLRPHLRRGRLVSRSTDATMTARVTVEVSADVRPALPWVVEATTLDRQALVSPPEVARRAFANPRCVSHWALHW